MGAILKRELGIPAIFRCHIGLEQDLPQTRAAWDFLQPFAEAYDYSVFSAPAYVPDFLTTRAGIIRPAIDPLSWKNRELTPQKLMGILCNSRLAAEQHPVVPLPYPEMAKRLCADGSFAPADHSDGIGILFRPIVAQISRWDRLKGFKPLLDGFVHLKRQLASQPNGYSERHRRRLELTRLVLAGPDPDAVADDPEGCEVLGELIDAYRELPHALQQDVALISLPMGSQKQNALMVNALQRCASIVVQNSIREGFGLTVTEAMWKRAAVLGSGAYGICQQVQDGVSGRVNGDAEDSEAIASCLDQMLEDLPERVRLGQNAQRRVHGEFLIFHQIRCWLELLSERLGP
jgi:trehalose synthase